MNGDQSVVVFRKKSAGIDANDPESLMKEAGKLVMSLAKAIENGEVALHHYGSHIYGVLRITFDVDTRHNSTRIGIKVKQ